MNRVSLLLIGLCLALGIASADTGLIVTVAGNGVAGTAGVGGPATSANLSAPSCAVRDTSGSLFIADSGNGYVYRVDASTSILTIVAGDGLTYATAGGGGGGPIGVAAFCVVLDQARNIYITDGHHNRILRTDAVTGIVTTVAGTGSSVSSGDGGQATNAGINGPAWLAIDSQGNLFVAEELAHKIRRIDAATGIITTVAGSGVAGFSGDGGSAIASSLNNPWAVSLDAGGNLFISEYSNLRVRRVDAATGIIATVAGAGTSYAFNGDGQQATAANILPMGTAVDAQGNLFIASFDRIRRVDALSGLISTVAGLGGQVGSQADGIPATSANFFGAAGVTLLPNGHLLASVTSAHRVREVYYPAPGGYTTTTLTATNTSPAVLTATVASSDGAAVLGQVAFFESTTMLGLTSVVNGTASLTLSNQTLGNHTISAVYGGNGSILGASSSPDFVQTVKAGVNVSVGSSQNPVAPNQTVSFGLTVSPAVSSAVPVGGTVQLMEGSTVLATATVNSGIAAISAAFADAGTHSLRAVYSGDANYASATSSTYSQSVGIAATVNLAVLPVSPITGQPATITATVSPSAATGTVNFLDNGITMGQATVSGATASISVIQSLAGPHTLTANYSGDASYFTANGSITVTWKNAATISLAVQPASPVAGQSASLTATLSVPSATGTVQFLDGATVLGTATLAGGVASFSTSALAAGSHTLTASYQGDALNLPVSASISATVKNAATIGLTLSPASPVAGQSATITATVSPSLATGTVQFLDGVTVLGTGILSGGVASLSTSALAAGSHNLTANYSGDALTSSISGSIIATVKNAATVGLTLSPASPVAGQPATITATVSPSSATGTVQFLDGATVLGTGTLSGGAASISTSALAAGLHTITASYAGDTLTLPASGSIGATVKAVTATSLTLANPQQPAFSAVTFTAQVSPAAATGTVQFLDGGTLLGTASVSGGAAVLTVSSLPVGIHPIQAVYSGSATYAGSSSALASQIIVKAAATLALGSTPNPSVYQQTVAVTATVSPAFATGLVQFFDNGSLVATVGLTGATATFTASSLGVGSHSLTATYNGDANFLTASAPALSQTVSKAATSTSLTTNLNPATKVQTVTFTAAVTSTNATGQIQFLKGTSVLATVNLTGGIATYSTSALSAGSNSITAKYLGDTKFLTSTSAVLVETITIR